MNALVRGGGTVLAVTSAVLHGASLSVLTFAMAAACLYCAYELWRFDTVRSWVLVAVMNIAMIAVHLPLMGHHGHTATPGAGMGTTMAVATVVAFAAVAAVGAGPLSRMRGLLRRDRLTGGALAFALLVLAGLPPGVIGLVAKVVALRPAVEQGLWPLVFVAVVAVVLGIAVYLRWFAVLIGDAVHGMPPYRAEDRPEQHLAALDTRLRGRWQPGDFVWPAAWEPAYPREVYWWLYGSPRVTERDPNAG